MLCDNCAKRQATTFIKRTVNGQTQELHLCPQCAAQLGYGAMMGSASLGLGSLLSSMLGQTVPDPQPSRLSDEVRCEGCGATFSDIVRTGKAGCAKCYETFYEQLLPSLQRIHGKTKHTGKVPQSASQQAKKNHHLAQLKEQLNQAVEAQDYEQAAKLRDEIQSLQEEGNQQ
ncbi:UvrB/UvrC motif-containing protein [Solibaculum mannosilyticum]|uniref:Excinuclease Uvr n=1 Tax=Solibaculum mannosilyticum TaxID=2780922 RepID=A0A7I8D2K8_9FIRM|nr:UvrB/UvrC motif-containing protein [Solibaculum mannosilyticum]MCO7137103.1 UvrB/UvrC motif-containing protein [[Clostridium] leptum]BCI59463.1 excinuclease Uvr [Solibaculum mannosilyticum]CZT55244.1 UvrABC system protein B [Eubacteriaceae bacterium CHKCI005]